MWEPKITDEEAAIMAPLEEAGEDAAVMAPMLLRAGTLTGIWDMCKAL
jgi:hypothetical protein